MLDILPIRFFARALAQRCRAAHVAALAAPSTLPAGVAFVNNTMLAGGLEEARDARRDRAKPSSARGSSAWRMSLLALESELVSAGLAREGWFLGDRGRTARTRRWRSSRIGSIMLSRAGCRYFPLRLVHLPTPGLPPWMRTCCVGRHGLLGARRRNRNRGSAPGRSALSSPSVASAAPDACDSGTRLYPFSSVRASHDPRYRCSGEDAQSWFRERAFPGPSGPPAPECPRVAVLAARGSRGVGDDIDGRAIQGPIV